MSEPKALIDDLVKELERRRGLYFEARAHLEALRGAPEQERALALAEWLQRGADVAQLAAALEVPLEATEAGAARGAWALAQREHDDAVAEQALGAQLGVSIPPGRAQAAKTRLEQARARWLAAGPPA